MKKKDIDLAGMNIYLNKSGNPVYYNIFDKKGYIVGHKVEHKFRLFYYRYFIIMALLILLGDYFKTFQNTILVTAFIGLAVEIYFRTVFLKQLKSIDNFKREKKISKLEIIIKSNEKEKTIVKACAYILLSILIVINAMQQNYNMVFVMISILVSLYAVYLAMLNSIAVSKMNIK